MASMKECSSTIRIWIRHSEYIIVTKIWIEKKYWWIHDTDSNTDTCRCRNYGHAHTFNHTLGSMASLLNLEQTLASLHLSGWPTQAKIFNIISSGRLSMVAPPSLTSDPLTTPPLRGNSLRLNFVKVFVQNLEVSQTLAFVWFSTQVFPFYKMLFIKNLEVSCLIDFFLWFLYGFKKPE